jgi:hypothetical protein
MKLQEMRSGAPIFRGRWAAIVWLWWSGELFGETKLPNGVSALEWASMGIGAVFLAMGVLSLDQYGRNAWFAWAPDGTEWSGVKREDVNRKSVLQPLFERLRRRC